MHGEDAVVICSGSTLEQAYYYFDVKGNAIDGKYQAAPPREYPGEIKIMEV